MSARLAVHRPNAVSAQPQAQLARPDGLGAENSPDHGRLVLASFVFSVPVLYFYAPFLNHARYILGNGADTRVAFGAVFEILSATAGIATAVVIFPIAKRASERMALGYVATRIPETTVIVKGLISLMSVLALRQD